MLIQICFSDGYDNLERIICSNSVRLMNFSPSYARDIFLGTSCDQFCAGLGDICVTLTRATPVLEFFYWAPKINFNSCKNWSSSVELIKNSLVLNADGIFNFFGRTRVQKSDEPILLTLLSVFCLQLE